MIDDHHQNATPVFTWGKLGLHVLSVVVLDVAETAVEEAKVAIRRGKALVELAGHLRASVEALGVSCKGGEGGETPAGAGEDVFDVAEQAPAVSPDFTGPAAATVDQRCDEGRPRRSRAEGDRIAAAARKGRWEALAGLLTPEERVELALELSGRA